MVWPPPATRQVNPSGTGDVSRMLETLDLSASNRMPWYIISIASLALIYLITRHWLSTTRAGNAAFNASFVGFWYAWLARFQFFVSAEKIVEQGYTQYKDRPWKLTGNDVLVLPHKYLEGIRKLPPNEANAMKANLDNIQSKYTHLEVLNSTRLFVIRRESAYSTILKKYTNSTAH
ncbi:uncharacterized protein BO95DRAFT_511951 [Aspergillus brunneoviolaceus CBS 621.78]|uniref:Uncharacterized protein n=1 Tax=Aspergillus brunneoviolaceus CBS 621.78 TaxID=1450534 RepID=A0ACD1GHR5_9EURO|nr:hypothetical protein BO95DRAFT_511951 [Aspergillus brunneoviolaceus CBS 621.78]RAH48767.1 hypothetical protein BO95DRAFT_511951 [Aspergillus brunneoviolaceus CBS 621.78]